MLNKTLHRTGRVCHVGVWKRNIRSAETWKCCWNWIATIDKINSRRFTVKRLFEMEGSFEGLLSKSREFQNWKIQLRLINRSYIILKVPKIFQYHFLVPTLGKMKCIQISESPYECTNMYEYIYDVNVQTRIVHSF